MTDRMPMADAWEFFKKRVFGKVGLDASDKGYGTSEDEKHQLLFLAGTDHSIGEIIYKAVRYRAKRNPDDLYKIAAWAFLLWWKEHGTP